jgi:hypothetical protein
MEEIVKEIKEATRWDRVFLGTHNNVIILFDLKEHLSIHGLKFSNKNPYLVFNEFKNIPIVFSVRMISVDKEQQTDQYWTLNGVIHRENGPAYISYNTKNSIARKYWYQYGFMNRNDGPTMENYSNFSIQEVHFEGEKYTKESWGAFHAFWNRDIETGKQPLDCPDSANFENGFRYRKQDGTMHDPNDDTPSFFSKDVSINWISDEIKTKKIISSLNPKEWEKYKDMILPKIFNITCLEEKYENNKMTKRMCESLNSTWIKYLDSQVRQRCFSRSLVPISWNNFIQKNMLSDINILSSPFYKDAESELISITELQRINNL